MTSTSASKGFEGHGSKTARERPSSIDTSNRLEICACVCAVGSLYIIPFLVVISAVATGIICALGLASVLSVSIASAALITLRVFGFCILYCPNCLRTGSKKQIKCRKYSRYYCEPGESGFYCDWGTRTYPYTERLPCRSNRDDQLCHSSMWRRGYRLF